MNKIKNIFIEGTAKSPQIDFNQLTGELILFGKSIPENAAKVYDIQCASKSLAASTHKPFLAAKHMLFLQ
jgi:hypothetical protein